jgi:hypothetical protein
MTWRSASADRSIIRSQPLPGLSVSQSLDWEVTDHPGQGNRRFNQHRALGPRHSATGLFGASKARCCPGQDLSLSSEDANPVPLQRVGRHSSECRALAADLVWIVCLFGNGSPLQDSDRGCARLSLRWPVGCGASTSVEAAYDRTVTAGRQRPQ